VVVASKPACSATVRAKWLPTATRTSCGIRCCVASTGSRTDDRDVATVQNRYNVGHRDDEDVQQACGGNDVGFIP